MPLLEPQFRVTHAREMTGILGSSLGALISLYAFFRHPERFGFVGAMSPALWFNDRVLLKWLEETSFVEGRVYLDMGTAEGDEHLQHVHTLHQDLLNKGYRPGESLFSVEEDHAAHDEEAWARRLRTALYFLLPPRVSPPIGTAHAVIATGG